MERVTISLEDGLLEEFDAFIKRKGYENRSEAIRDLLRHHLEQDRLAENRAQQVMGCLSYVYNHHERDLSQRLTSIQHEHHDLMLSGMHVHLDHDNCMEVQILRGPIQSVRDLSNQMIAETGVRHGNLNLVSVDITSRTHHHHSPDSHSGHEHGHDHSHDHGPGGHSHAHIKPRS